MLGVQEKRDLEGKNYGKEVLMSLRYWADMQIYCGFYRQWCANLFAKGYVIRYIQCV